MAHLNALTQGMTFTSASETANDVAGPNKDAKFNLAHLPSDAVVVKSLGGASETGRVGSSGLEADKTYILRAVTSDETDYGTAGKKPRCWLLHLQFTGRLEELRRLQQVV